MYVIFNWVKFLSHSVNSWEAAIVILMKPHIETINLKEKR
ncbi:hypothetical protein HME9304_02317 [Flagellimonas maritima]|uniref:Uncharacterized protein n=1 Tax=Flagellimonas maritima TaxID=1383885 RepID=A0A2Z4LUP6_9FLAO|nr:hypothetical protein HME9304_02317 [Allomuricauda aurantiaca]